MAGAARPHRAAPLARLGLRPARRRDRGHLLHRGERVGAGGRDHAHARHRRQRLRAGGPRRPHRGQGRHGRAAGRRGLARLLRRHPAGLAQLRPAAAVRAGAAPRRGPVHCVRRRRPARRRSGRRPRAAGARRGDRRSRRAVRGGAGHRRRRGRGGLVPLGAPARRHRGRLGRRFADRHRPLAPGGCGRRDPDHVRAGRRRGRARCATAGRPGGRSTTGPPRAPRRVGG